ncbi:IclR family transcriptional regulator [Roseobacter denitrificans]|uniref:Transcriptional regulator, putative n=1 Tax=Roseobacter denitrificans (strain ATCC 33942 / OCh 114) TaxID=375451 RepID=Q162H0_ROSDO|nr:helix-turn-helix domain-containing protein [Roseobacter denitrificans]ABG33123.1 transcriptional regulator, putative [Roseobacter denitrificans OCh 114]AVL52490.1 IclR family transcriptional regulator [Roseobacter denitrificans]SFG07528.1 transcriptional regulator, IclR family [Roseobacter denitrificans OCh 114]
MTKLNRSVERSMKILEVVSGSGVTSLAFLAEQTGLPKPTIMRICATPVNQRWLTQSRSDSRYRIGSRFPRLGAAPAALDALVEAGSSEIVHLSEETGVGVDLAAAIGNGRVEIVDTTRKFSEHGIFPDCIGYRPSPFRSALGCAFLAALGADERAEVAAKLAVNTKGKDREAALRLPDKLREIRTKGYATREYGYWGRAVDYGGIPNAISVAMRADGRAIGALSLVWLAERNSVEEVADAYLERLTEAADAIGRHFASGADI